MIPTSGFVAEKQIAADEHSTPAWHSLPPIFRTHAARSANAVLLETAKPNGETDRSYLFLRPHEELIAHTPNDLDTLFREIDRHVSAGSFVAGYFHYECGTHLLGMPLDSRATHVPEKPIAWLGVFRSRVEFDHSSGTIHGDLSTIEGEASVPELHSFIEVDEFQIDPKNYRDRFDRIQNYLQAGDTYQVNFTDRIVGKINSTPLAIYNDLLRQQPVPYAAMITKASETILSFSPELFFRTSHGKIIVRPMKGTWARGRNVKEDRAASDRLVHDEKNRSEHVMIVDLLRNDLGRICEFGSIKVEKLFDPERYRTLIQMTSTISGQLRAELSPSDVFRALFPSGSVTGAPKKRTMEIIRELELNPRAIYTGSIGYFGPGGESCFNVAIRTMMLRASGFVLGVGGGITAGSDASDEYEECLLKAAFLSHRAPSFSLIETMRAVDGIPLLDLHMKRLAESAEYFDIRYDGRRLRDELTAVARACGSVESRVRVELNDAGFWKISTTLLKPSQWHGGVLLADKPVNSRDIFRHHKTTHRQFFEQQLELARDAGFDEVIFLNESAALTEGAISNIFLYANNKWITPALTCGVLPGVYRSTLVSSLPAVVEREVYSADLIAAEKIFVCNALHGVRAVTRIENSAGDVLWADPGTMGTSEAL